MKFIIFTCFFVAVTPCFACIDSKVETKPKVFARVLQKSGSELDLAVFYPKEIDNANLSSVTFGYFEEDEFIFLIEAKIRNDDFGLPNINLEKYASSYIALKAEALSDLNVSISYSLPPSSDGSVSLCNHTENYKLNEILETHKKPRVIGLEAP